ncbi:ribonuclease E inhibitor RraB [Erysipelotrichaceae bacterium HCN-30851]
MKKVIPVLAVLAGAAALVAYKLKKDEEKKIVDLDQGLLEDEENIDENDMEEEEIEEGPISQPGYINQVNEAVKEEEPDENNSSLTEDEVTALQNSTQQKMDEMLQEGDVHENERPVQHYIEFNNSEDLENFKSNVINQGFVISKGKTDLELVVLHISPIEKEKLMNNILCIADEAKKHNGKYLGWDSKIIY